LPSSNRSIQDIGAEALKRRLMRGGGLTVGAQALRSLVKLAAQIIIARFLVPEDYGLIVMVTPVLLLVQLVSDFGFSQTIIQRPDLSNQDLSNLFWLGVIINITLAGVMSLTSPLMVWLYHEPRILLVSFVLAGLIPLSGLLSLPAALMTRDMRFAELAIVDVIPPVSALIAALFAAWSGMGYWSLIIGTASESATGVILVWPLSAWVPNRPALNKSTWALVRIGGHITGYNVAQFLTTTVDNILLSLVWGEISLGLYDKGYKIVTQPIVQALAPINRISVPLLVRLLPDPERYKTTYFRILRSILMIMFPAIIFILVLSKSLVLFLLGSQWSDIWPIVSWLCVGAFASPVYTSTYWLFVSQGRVTDQLRYAMITSIISVGSFIAGLPWGPAGVAAGAGLSFVFLSTPSICWGATRAGSIKLKDIGRAISSFVVAGLPTAGLLFMFATYTSMPGLLSLLLGCLLSYATFFMILLGFSSGRIVNDALQLRRLLCRPSPTQSS
jgi:polysaccharide transporter, PST family